MLISQSSMTDQQEPLHGTVTQFLMFLMTFMTWKDPAPFPTIPPKRDWKQLQVELKPKLKRH